MRVTLLTTGLPRFRGDLFGFFVAELAQTLARQGEEVRLVAPGAAGVPGRENHPGVEIHRVTYALPQRLQKLAYGGGLVPNLRARPVLALLLPQFLLALGLGAARRAVRSDLFHGQWVVSGWLGLATRFIHGRPVVVTLRGSDLALLRRLPRTLARWSLAGFEAVTMVSEEIRRAVIDLGLSPEKVFLTPNGVNLELFRPLDQGECRTGLGLDKDRPILIWAGRLAPEKGVGDLIRAMPFILEIHPRARLILIGQGPQLGELKELRTRLDLEKAVELRPAVPRQDLAQWYNAADLVCLPSHREGRPNILLEALACGRPILTTAVGGVPEIIEEGRTGRLVEPGRPEAMGRAGADLLDRPELLAKMGRAGPETLEEMGLTWPKAAGRVREVYELVLRRRREQGREVRLIGRPWTLWLAAAWAAVVSGIFLVRYWRTLDAGYGITDKLAREGLGGILARWLGF